MAILSQALRSQYPGDYVWYVNGYMAPDIYMKRGVTYNLMWVFCIEIFQNNETARYKKVHWKFSRENPRVFMEYFSIRPSK